MARVGQGWRGPKWTWPKGNVLNFLLRIRTSFFERLKTSLTCAGRQRSRCGVSGVFWVWRKKVVHRSAAMVAEELDLPAEPQLPELPRPPLAAPSSKLELLRSVSASGCSAPCSAAPYIPALNRSYSRPPPAAACRCAANSGRCCRCRGLQRTRTSICSDVDGSVPPRDVQHARAGLAQFVSTCREQRQRTGFWRARPTATRWSALPRRPHSSTPVRAPTRHAARAALVVATDAHGAARGRDAEDQRVVEQHRAQATRARAEANY